MSATTDIVEYSQNYSHNGSKTTCKIRLFIEDQILSKKRFPLSIFPWLKISELKKEIEKSRIIKNATQYNLRLFYKNIEMANGRQNVTDYNLESDSIIVAQINDQRCLTAGIVNPYNIFEKTHHEVTQLIMKVVDGLQGGSRPKLTAEGTSGTYILENSKNHKVAIFKPYDEQPYAPNNPRNYIGKLGSEGIRKGILSGENATREVAAYILSANSKPKNSKKVSQTGNYHGVPVTTYVQFYHPSFTNNSNEVSAYHPITCPTEKEICTAKQSTKHGSLQQFMQFNDVAGNFSSSVFSVQQVHKIAILDLRILNCDRNQANIGVRKLTRKGEAGKPSIFYQLIPIDHGLSFPDNFEIHEHEITWMDYSQVRNPMTAAQLQFIENIDPIQDTQKLRDKLGFRPICLRNFRIAELFLKKAAKAGFTLYQIGKMVYRESNDLDDSQDQSTPPKKKNKRSELQNLVIRAQNLYSLIQQHNGDIKEPLQEHIQRLKQQNGSQKLDSKQSSNHGQIHEQQEEHEQEADASNQNSDQEEEDEVSSFQSNEQPSDSPAAKPDNTIQQELVEESPTLDSSLTNSQELSELILEGVKMSTDQQNEVIKMVSNQEVLLETIHKDNRDHIKKSSEICRRILHREMTSQLASKEPRRKKKRNISLPHLKKRTTSYRESKYQARRMREGPNGVNKPHIKKQQNEQQWGHLFFHYFQDLLDTFLIQKRNTIKKVQSA